MKLPYHIWRQIRGISANDLIRALRRDGWSRDVTSGAIRIYRHPSGKRISIHYHPSKTFGEKLLKALLDDTGWTEQDMRRIELIK